MGHAQEHFRLQIKSEVKSKANLEIHARQQSKAESDMRLEHLKAMQKAEKDQAAFRSRLRKMRSPPRTKKKSCKPAMVEETGAEDVDQPEDIMGSTVELTMPDEDHIHISA